MSGQGYGFHRDVPNSELDILAAGTIIWTASSTAVTIPAAATSGLTIVAGGLNITAGGLTITAGGLTSADSATLFGYATGAGGSAAGQAANKAATVVLSKPCGLITTHNAALAANTEISFQVTNTLVSITDVIACCVQSGGTTGEYEAHISDVGSGTFEITLANMTAGSLSDAVLINFAVISSVVA